MEWFSQNWVWVLFAVGMIAMHMFGPAGSVDPYVTRSNFGFEGVPDFGFFNFPGVVLRN